MKAAVYAVNWTEYERGWGSRPDGHTLHLTEEVAKEYISDYWARQPKNVPDEYSAPGVPAATAVDIKTYEKIVAHYGEFKRETAYWGHHSNWI